MSVDVYGYVMAAVPYDTVVTQKTEVTEVTRYNELTGEPYIKKIKKTKTFVGTQEVEMAKGGPQSMLADLGLLSYSRDDDSDLTHIGIVIDEIDRSTPTCILDTERALLKREQLKEKLASIGITDVQPQIVFGLLYSY